MADIQPVSSKNCQYFEEFIILHWIKLLSITYSIMGYIILQCAIINSKNTVEHTCEESSKWTDYLINTEENGQHRSSESRVHGIGAHHCLGKNNESSIFLWK